MKNFVAIFCLVSISLTANANDCEQAIASRGLESEVSASATCNKLMPAEVYEAISLVDGGFVAKNDFGYAVAVARTASATDISAAKTLVKQGFYTTFSNALPPAVKLDVLEIAQAKALVVEKYSADMDSAVVIARKYSLTEIQCAKERVNSKKSNSIEDGISFCVRGLE